MKKIILGLALGIILCASSVYAVTRLKAEEVSYSDKTVKDAIDDLYTKSLTSGDCVKGKFQLTENASTSVGDEILDFAPSIFYISFYDKNLPVGGTIWNGGSAYYNKSYSENIVSWISLFDTDVASTDLSSCFLINNNLIIKNLGQSWKNQVVDYVACK